MNDELEAEGYARELSRAIQSERKKAGLIKKNRINLEVISDEKTIKILKMNEKFIKERVNAKNVLLTTGEERFKNLIELKIKEKRVGVTFKRV